MTCRLWIFLLKYLYQLWPQISSISQALVFIMLYNVFTFVFVSPGLSLSPCLALSPRLPVSPLQPQCVLLCVSCPSPGPWSSMPEPVLSSDQDTYK